MSKGGGFEASRVEPVPGPGDFGGWYTFGVYPLGEEGREDLKKHARSIVVDLVNSNTVGLRTGLDADSEKEGFHLKLRAAALIEIIWMHVRDAALGGTLRRCADCGTPFLVTDKRQNFCPPDLPGGKSRCAARSLKRRQRGR